MPGYYAVYNDESLQHHGIKGMKWGVRRYQSYDTTGARKGGKTGKEVGEAKAQDNRLSKTAKGKIRAHLGRTSGSIVGNYLLSRSAAKANKKAGVSKKDAKLVAEFGARKADKIKSGKTTADRERTKRKVMSAVIGGVAGGAAGAMYVYKARQSGASYSGKAAAITILGGAAGGTAYGAILGNLGGFLNKKITGAAVESAYKNKPSKKG